MEKTHAQLNVQAHGIYLDKLVVVIWASDHTYYHGEGAASTSVFFTMLRQHFGYGFVRSISLWYPSGANTTPQL